MVQIDTRRTEITNVQFTLDKELTLYHARWVRGAIAQRINRPEFHHHEGKGVIYQHPCIRYNVSVGQAQIMGMAEGAFLLRKLPRFDSLPLGNATYRVIEQRMNADRLEIGPCDDPVIYHFHTPYLALNQENHNVWLKNDPFNRRQLLQRIVVGNLLSVAKSINLHVTAQLHADVELVPDDWYELKPGVRLLGFRGAIQVNFLLPEYWGIGKSSARGFGTLSRKED